MNFIKQHLILLVSGVVAAASIGLAVFGVLSMSKITGRMDASVSLWRSLDSARQSRGGAINPQAITALETAVNETKANYEKIRDEAEKVNAREPLRDGIFPELQQRSLAFAFRRAYREAIDGLPALLKGGPKPSSVDIDNWRMALQEQARAAGAGVFAPQQIDDPIKIDPAARASIDRARKIRCYAGLDSFDVRPLYSAADEPTLAQMWDAQMSLWIQRDVVDVIAAINDEAAAKLPNANVLNMPIKRIVGIRVGEYVPERQTAAVVRSTRERASSDEVAPPPSDPDDVFTGRKPNSLYDIVYFRTQFVVDSRIVQEVIERIAEKNLYTPIQVAMHEVERSDNFRDYLYGPDPVVELDIAYEALFLRDAYERLMPDAVLDQIEGGTGSSRRRRPTPSPQNGNRDRR